MSSGTPLYVQRRELVDGLSDDATEDDYTEAFRRIVDGDLSDKRFPAWIRELAWWLLLGNPQDGITQKDAAKAGRYVGITVEVTTVGSARGWVRTGHWRHG